MNHIKEMFEMTGIFPMRIFACKISQTDKDNKCNCFEDVLPDFTPEKQLEIIKEIGLRVEFKIIANESYDWILTEDMYAKHEYNKQWYNVTDFTQALAQFTTELIKANELDKNKVKEILEDAR